MSTDWRFHFLQTATPKTDGPVLIGEEQQGRCEESEMNDMSEFESLLRELAKVDREMTAHLNANPGTSLELLSTGVREEWNEIVRRKYRALDTIVAIAIAKYKNEQL